MLTENLVLFSQHKCHTGFCQSFVAVASSLHAKGYGKADNGFHSEVGVQCQRSDEAAKYTVLPLNLNVGQ